LGGTCASRGIADTDSFGEAFSVDATEQFHGDVDVSISSSRHDRRRKIVALNHSHRVTAPAQANTNPGLRRESHFIGVDTHEQKHICRTVSRAANAERCATGSCPRRSIARGIGRVGGSDARSRGGVVGQHRGATRLARIGAQRLRSGETYTGENGPTPVHEGNVRF
jgi:hypothetical protein